MSGAITPLRFNSQNGRLIYLASYQHLQIVPLLHKNTVPLMGVLVEEYLAYKRDKDHFMALTKQNTINMWSVTTGKLMKKQNLKKADIDFGKFEQFELFGSRVLLVGTIGHDNMKDE